MAESRSLFGFEFKRKSIEKEKKPVSFTPDNEDGAYESITNRWILWSIHGSQWRSVSKRQRS